MEGSGGSYNMNGRKPCSFRLRSSSLNSVRLRRVFDLFDKNGDEMITADEIAEALVVLGLEDADPSESAVQVQSMISSYVKPGSQGLSFEDFTLLHKSLDQAFFNNNGSIINININSSTSTRAVESSADLDLAEAFKVFDEDGDGYISATELQLVLNKLGLPQGREMERVQKMISSVDRNHDGFVDFSEFKYMMRHFISIAS